MPLPWDCTNPTWKTRPCFTPDNQFTLSADALATQKPGPDAADAKVFDPRAYVRDGYLVVQLPDDTVFWFPGYKALVVAYPVKLQKGLVAGKLTRGADKVWRFSVGTVGGRVSSTDLGKSGSAKRSA